MSSKDIAIKVEKISKRYRIGLKEEINEDLAGAIFDFIKSPLKNYRRYRSLYKFNDIEPENDQNSTTNNSDIIWALRDVSFEVKQGEILGIIGSNGAGKSTLLKILSKITDPTSGHAEIRGKISSLLEVGTGFHPELTGRENVYLNGTILGMRKVEVDCKFDKIVAFSGIGKFIDTPVKRYSSGMAVRLAFSVAAHLEPEILLVDEVLAVGDVAFQKKCIGKMNAVAKEGRTILFVSHNMGAIENLCDLGVWLEDGKVVMHGGVGSVISAYLKSNTDTGTNNLKHYGSGDARVIDIRVLDSNGSQCNAFKIGEKMVVEFGIEFFKSFDSVDFIGVEIKQAETGLNVVHLLGQDCGFILEKISIGKRRIRVEIPDCMLYPGPYQISIWVGGGKDPFDYVQGALNFIMVQSSVSMRTTPFNPNLAIFHLPSIWQEI